MTTREQKRVSRLLRMDLWNVYIYQLIDPRDGSVRYVGQSSSPYRRVFDHMATRHSLKTNPTFAAWLISLSADGLFPDVLIVSHSDHIGAWQAEKEQVTRALAAGHQLFNRMWVVKPTRRERCKRIALRSEGIIEKL